ncbi:DUF4129 domain-containing protein [Streptomyces sp. ASQP_92]|uniref:DUF4129 domain-containing protein n=1 Tax=Streptomyces sp. ASQP_92 TaxID=2979116 RepID=UPI0021C1376D|nr:DUF4129 domain-containing protein [Streptomyces sp. ASQP_92]MCT9087250.1 DUF4129 domain-containing protein [Streptomyces sp. ASQP_92]
MSEAGGFIATHVLTGASGTPPVDIGRDLAREAARRELSDPAYHQHDPSLLQRALDTFWDWVGGLFDSASGATPGGPLGLIMLAVVVICLVAALWWRLGTPQRAISSGGTVFDDRPRSAAEHRTAAEAHANALRWNAAVQEQMRAIVRSLEERALLDPRPGRTADEAAAEAGRPLPGHAVRLRAAARAFDDVTYGGRTADEAAYIRLRDLDRDLRAAKPALNDAAQGVSA